MEFDPTLLNIKLSEFPVVEGTWESWDENDHCMNDRIFVLKASLYYGEELVSEDTIDYERNSNQF